MLTDPHTVQLANGDRVRAAYVLIATGGTPSYGDPIPGLEHAITSNEAFHLPALPPQVLIQGGGYIAVEFAGIFAGLGAHVTLVYRGDNILRGFDDEVRAASAHGYGEAGHPGADRLQSSGHRGDRVTPLGAAIRRRSCQRRLRDVCNGSAPERCQAWPAGSGRRDQPRMAASSVDEYSRTSVPNIYAVGDVTNRVNLTPVAIREAGAFADTVFGGKPTAVDHSNVPTAVFSDPEVGAVGLTEAQARSGLAQTDIYRAMFRPMKATLSGRDTTVLLKLVVDGLTDRVVGCHIVGEGAAEMIQLAAVAVKMGPPRPTSTPPWRCIRPSPRSSSPCGRERRATPAPRRSRCM